MTTYTLRKTDSTGLYLEDIPNWDDEAIAAIPAVVGIQKILDGVPEIDKDGKPIWDVAPQAEIPAVPPLPFPAGMIPGDVPGGFIHPKWDGTKWIEGKPRTPAQLAAITATTESDAAKIALLAIDLRSIRSMREFLLAKFGTDPLMPAQLKAAGDAAAVERIKIK